MAETRPTKRARVDDDGSSVASNDRDPEMGDDRNGEEEELVERSEVVWYSDGNVILQAGGKQFRVHKSMLSKYSGVFNDMFKVPQPLPTADDTVNGCPIVKLEGDDSDHWERLLELLYDGRRSYATSPRFEFSLVESLITLGDKYDFKHLLKDALSQFEASFPRELTFFSTNEFPKTGFTLDDDSTLCNIVELAQTFNIETSLPVLYYFIVTQDSFPAMLYRGLISESAMHYEFSEHTQETLIVGRDRIYQGMAKHQFRYLWPKSCVVPASGCGRPDACRVALEALLVKIWKPVPKVYRALRPYGKTFHAEGLCLFCSSAVQNEFKKEQKAFWKHLPTYFGLPAWEKLSQGPVIHA